jgi:hypothetical protein
MAGLIAGFSDFKCRYNKRVSSKFQTRNMASMVSKGLVKKSLAPKAKAFLFAPMVASAVTTNTGK